MESEIESVDLVDDDDIDSQNGSDDDFNDDISFVQLQLNLENERHQAAMGNQRLKNQHKLALLQAEINILKEKLSHYE